MNHPSVKEVRRKIPAVILDRSTIKGLFLVTFATMLWGLSFAGIMLCENLGLKFLLGCTNAGFTAMLFIIGHDACHGALTPSARLNRIIGRIAFLPALHPYSAWDLGHNKLHHCFTNLRTKDYVWAPLSPEEFRLLSPQQQLIQRVFRSPLGVGLYYLTEIWWKHMIAPRQEDRRRLKMGVFHADLALVAVFSAVLLVLAIELATSPPIALANIITGIVVPQALWNWLVGFVVFLHHTHPKVRWYDRPDEWDFFAGQIEGTVHVQFPWPFGPLLHHIMEHTAHHVDPRIPLYNLPPAQRVLEQAYPGSVVNSKFTWSDFFRILKTCQLYDYRSHRWLTFAGLGVQAADLDKRPVMVTQN